MICFRHNGNNRYGETGDKAWQRFRNGNHREWPEAVLPPWRAQHQSGFYQHHETKAPPYAVKGDG